MKKHETVMNDNHKSLKPQQNSAVSAPYERLTLRVVLREIRKKNLKQLSHQTGTKLYGIISTAGRVSYRHGVNRGVVNDSRLGGGVIP